ncbi:sodium- and chloride-dependent glycine transporter 1 [Patella vulgata]|uniref:sodium- and chloride-dependent glycine transporter 1 n=1 Tax=Patella vulgata TaxID=6465 RepID=UPI00217FE3C9|nr:sodium- and chloride-dependent glycine transporter 1 [Patella vulgata]
MGEPKIPIDVLNNYEVVSVEQVTEPMLTDYVEKYGREISYNHKLNPMIQVEDTDEYNSNDSTLSQEEERANWGGKMEFLLTCIGYAVGLGNVWRFPYLCYKNGGGAFLIPYIIMLAVVGLPLFFMELAFGQYASLGPIAIWSINPMFKGLGYGMVIASWLISLYYNVIIAHTLFYLASSFTSELPWITCNNTWNTDNCLPYEFTLTDEERVNYTAAHAHNGTMNTPSEEYYKYYVLEQSEHINEFGSVSWKLALCLLASWVIVGICLLRGIQSLGKVVYFTAIFPYVMLTILMIRGVTLDGAVDGIIYYLKPDFSRLSDPRVWSDAATQIFYSLSACSGGLIAMSSYNKFNNNCLKDSLIVAVINCATSIFAGFVIFSILGFMAHEKGVEVSKVAAGGPGLAFIVYPEAIARMPVSPLWAVFFFLMMATLGFGSQFSIVECVLSALTDEFPRYLRTRKGSYTFRIAIMASSFLLGLPMVCKGGIYLLNLVDYSVGGFPLLVVGFLELVVLNWIYGYDKFSENIEMMIGSKPSIYWHICWKYVSPITVFVTILCNIILYKEPTFDDAPYPAWGIVLGWLISSFPIVVIPAWALYKYCSDGGLQLLKVRMRPTDDWGPMSQRNNVNIELPVYNKKPEVSHAGFSHLISSTSTVNTVDTPLGSTMSVAVLNNPKSTNMLNLYKDAPGNKV